jgi:DNA-directed RNA polymerase sigma subunit (sigma70/sigma32)
MKCFNYNQKNGQSCLNNQCRYWIECEKSNNCCILMLKAKDYNEDKTTLQDIGDIFKVTRMRICQIEKNAIKKLKDKLTSLSLID